jgi:hypothetical protein
MKHAQRTEKLPTIIGIYGKCMTQTKSMNHTNIHTGKVWGMSLYTIDIQF